MNRKPHWIFLVSMMAWIPAARGDVFYDQRLTAGKAALIAGQNVDAAEQLRIAAFGFLDDPTRLQETLALLAIAQSNVGGRAEELQATLLRFVEVETRFGAYNPASLRPDQARLFESLLVRSIPKPTLLAIDSLARLAQPAEPKRATSKRGERKNVAPPVVMPPAPTPQQVAMAPTKTTTPQPVATAPTKTTTPPKTTTPTPAPVTPSSKTASEILRDAQSLIANGKAAEGAAMLDSALIRFPGRRDLRLALLQGASLASNWTLAAKQVTALEPFDDDEVVYMFYGAVSLFETGSLVRSRNLLDRSLPRLARSPFVDQYAKKIMAGRSGT